MSVSAIKGGSFATTISASIEDSRKVDAGRGFRDSLLAKVQGARQLLCHF